MSLGMGSQASDLPSLSHLHDELAVNPARVTIETVFGPVIGGRATNGAAVFLEMPYALPPERFTDPQPLPTDYRYPKKEYIRESLYAVQPLNDGQAAGSPFEDKVGYGEPTENPLFLNIVSPPSFSPGNSEHFPVRVYVHGGFLQFGSPHGLSSQAQYVSAFRNEVWVNIGYRLSAFGYLANDEEHARLDGNFGFKDQWVALEWVKANIHSFGGDPTNIGIVGLSAGAHSVHQLLHHASRLPDGARAPFTSADLQSNAIVTNPKTPQELRSQFHALCTALDLDPSAKDVLETLRDSSRIPASRITKVIEELGEYGTFRGTLGGSWWSTSSGELDPLESQRSGEFARALRAKGIRSILVGDLSEEWYLYSIAHPLVRSASGSWADSIIEALERYFQPSIVERVCALYPDFPPANDASEKEAMRIFGQLLADGQVHLPVRMLWRDLTSDAARAGDKPSLKVVRYAIRWSPEQVRPEGFVTHGTDRSLWAYRLSTLKDDQVKTAQAWLSAIDEALTHPNDHQSGPEHPILVLRKDRTIGWEEDHLWENLLQKEDAYRNSSLAHL